MLRGVIFVYFLLQGNAHIAHQTFEVVGLYGEGQTLTSPTLEGFAVDLNEIFGV